MSFIKTSGGKIVTKNGKPSCSCCGPICLVYPGVDPDLPEASVNDATFDYPPPFAYVENFVQKVHPDLYDLSVIDISPFLYQTILAGGTWSYTSLLEADIVTGGNGSASLSTETTQDVVIKNICEYSEDTLTTNQDGFALITYIDRKLYFHPSNPTLRKAKIVFASEIRRTDWPVENEQYLIEFRSAFWPVSGTNDVARVNSYFGADLTLNIGSDSFHFDETDGFQLVQSLWYSHSAHLTVTATFSASAP